MGVGDGEHGGVVALDAGDALRRDAQVKGEDVSVTRGGDEDVRRGGAGADRLGRAGVPPQQGAACGGLDVEDADGRVAGGGCDGGVVVQPGDVEDGVVVRGESRVGGGVHLVL